MDETNVDRPDTNDDLWSDVQREAHVDSDTDADGEREADEHVVEHDVAERLDAPFEVPVPDVIDQLREVDLGTDDDAG